ncbi:hypothetical protein LUZ60_005712 [Juncus effusus]|nr:hypothetical protein LUZ60_005712 [Juncus effusus]
MGNGNLRFEFGKKRKKKSRFGPDRTAWFGSRQMLCRLASAIFLRENESTSNFSTKPTLKDQRGEFHVAKIKTMDYASQEERKIWEELEAEIERDLEVEIKDGLSRLARQLQILYHHKRRKRTIMNSQIHKDEKVHKDEDFLDLSIVIKLGIGCNIEINEGQINGDDILRPHSSRSEPVMDKSHNRTEKKKTMKGKLIWKY